MEAKQFGYVREDENAKSLDVLVYSSELDQQSVDRLTLRRMSEPELQDYLTDGQAFRDGIIDRLVSTGVFTEVTS